MGRGCGGEEYSTWKLEASVSKQSVLRSSQGGFSSARSTTIREEATSTANTVETTDDALLHLFLRSHLSPPPLHCHLRRMTWPVATGLVGERKTAHRSWWADMHRIVTRSLQLTGAEGARNVPARSFGRRGAKASDPTRRGSGASSRGAWRRRSPSTAVFGTSVRPEVGRWNVQLPGFPTARPFLLSRSFCSLRCLCRASGVWWDIPKVMAGHLSGQQAQFNGVPPRVLRLRPVLRGGLSPARPSPLSAQRGQHSSSFWNFIGHDNLAHRCLLHRDLPSLQWHRMHFISPKGCTVGCHSSPLWNTCS